MRERQRLGVGPQAHQECAPRPKMADLSDLYQEVILDHNKRPRNYRTIENASHQAEGYNPLCGDRLRVFMNVDEGLVTDIAFQGSGCAISRASASLMTDSVKGRPVDEVRSMFARFHRMVTTRRIRASRIWGSCRCSPACGSSPCA